MSEGKKPTARNAQLLRILGILRDLDRLGGVDIYELAERYGTTTRTIRRDFDALHDVGLPLEEDTDGKRKRWHVAFKHQLQRVSDVLEAGHYMALRMAVGQGGALRNASAVFSTLEDLSSKIEDALGPKGRGRLATIDSCFHSYEKHAYAAASPDIFWPVIDAIAGGNTCEVTYRSPKGQGASKTFGVRPLKLFTYQNAAYVMCKTTKHGSYLNLNVQRIGSIKVTDEVTPMPADFDATLLENAAFGVYSSGAPTTYILHFGTELAPYIRERIWHPSQVLTDLSDGVELRFTCGASYEVTAWVASWRKGVRVVAPAQLREELAGFGAWCAQEYAHTDKP